MMDGMEMDGFGYWLDGSNMDGGWYGKWHKTFLVQLSGHLFIEKK
jgi:hypothetical protein